MRKVSFAKLSVLTCIGLGLTCLPALNADNMNGMNRANSSDPSMKDARDLGVKVEQVGDYDDDNDDDDVSDQDIMEDIQDAIGPGLVSRGYENVKATVMNGVVTLTGSVATQSDKEKVEKNIRDIDGVDQVNSQITVQDISTKADADKKFASDTFSTSADDQLNKKIRDSVSRGWLWDSYKEVVLNTKDGNVTLTGSVAKMSDQEKLISEIQKIEGVKSVTSNLIIRDNK